jgi:hypothetical protein
MNLQENMAAALDVIRAVCHIAPSSSNYELTGSPIRRADGSWLYKCSNNRVAAMDGGLQDTNEQVYPENEKLLIAKCRRRSPQAWINYAQLLAAELGRSHGGHPEHAPG